jgi:hypothetical protein
MRWRQVSDRGQNNPDGDHKHAAEPDRQIAPQCRDLRLELGSQPRDVRLEVGLRRDRSPVVANSAPDIASARASAVSPACCGEKPALSGRRASLKVSNGTAAMGLP